LANRKLADRKLVDSRSAKLRGNFLRNMITLPSPTERQRR
jgi:hypothetical protein